MKSILHFIILLLTGYSVFAQVPSSPNENIWFTDNKVKTITVDGDYTYIGGNFNYVGPNTGAGVKITTTSPLPSTSFPKVKGGNISCVISDGSGGWYLCGEFTQVGAYSRNGLAHITSSGTVDSWNLSYNNQITSIVIYDGYLYIGGSFTNIGGVSVNCLARVNLATGNFDEGWKPNPSGFVSTMAVNSTGQLYIFGFTMSYELFLKKIDCTSGAIDGTWSAGTPDNFVSSIAVNSSDEVFIGGMFTMIGTTPVNYLAKLDPTSGALVSDWTPSLDKEIEKIVASGSYLYVCGAFDNIGSETISKLARINSSTGEVDNVWKPAPNQSVSTVAIDADGNVYAGGGFTIIGGKTRSYIAKLDKTDGTADDSWSSSADNVIQTIAINGSDIYAGGSFNSFGGQPRIRLAKLSSSTGELVTGWKADLDVSGSFVNSIAVNGDYVYVGGEFSTIGGVAIPHLARVDINTGTTDESWNPLASDAVSTMFKDGTNIYVGGGFGTIFSSTAYKNFVKLDASGNPVPGWTPAPNGTVSAIAVDGGNLYAAGSFMEIDGQPRTCLAELDKTTGHLVSAWTPTNNGGASSLVVDGSYVYMMGVFTKVNENESYSGLARVDKTDGTLDLTWYPAPRGNVNSIAFSGSDIFAGGSFDRIGGQDVKYLAKINNSNGNADASWNPVLDFAVNSLIIKGDILLAGGDFTNINGYKPGYFAAFTSSGALPVELISFTAQAINKGVELRWKTATEVNNYGFEIERSLVTGHQSLVKWEKVGFVTGAGNSNSSKEYSFTDENPPSGNIQYRIKQIDTDGKFEYFGTIAEVNLSLTDVKEMQIPKEFGLSQNFPNPFNPSTVISYKVPVTCNVTLKIYDALGRDVKTLVDENQQPGYYNISFDGSSYASGIYIYRLTAGKFNSTKKLMMIK
jgi:hypothetical protein